MISNKFDYVTLSRKTIDGSRKYSTPDGRYLPSVTTILSATKSEESVQALNEWRKRIGVDKATEITTQAASRGTKMHTYLENYVKNGNLPERTTNPGTWASHAMAKTMIDCGLNKVTEWFGIEVSLFYPELYAGTTDGIGVVDGEITIIDFKQTNKRKREEWIDDYKCQIAAYAIAHDKLYGTAIKRGHIMMCIRPPVDQYGIIAGQPEYQEFILSENELNRAKDAWWNRVEKYFEMNRG